MEKAELTHDDDASRGRCDDGARVDLGTPWGKRYLWRSPVADRYTGQGDATRGVCTTIPRVPTPELGCEAGLPARRRGIGWRNTRGARDHSARSDT